MSLLSLLTVAGFSQTDSTAKQKNNVGVKPNHTTTVKKQSATKNKNKTQNNQAAVVVKKESPDQMKNKAVKMEKIKKENSK